MTKTISSGYCDCACRDCFEIAIRDEGESDALCHECDDAGCEPHAGKCQAPGAYECDGDEEDHEPPAPATGGLAKPAPYEPSVVLPELLAELAAAAPEAWRRLTAPGGSYSQIPAAAMADGLHPWWDGAEAAAILLALLAPYTRPTLPPEEALPASAGGDTQ